MKWIKIILYGVFIRPWIELWFAIKETIGKDLKTLYFWVKSKFKRKASCGNCHWYRDKECKHWKREHDTIRFRIPGYTESCGWYERKYKKKPKKQKKSDLYQTIPNYRDFAEIPKPTKDDDEDKIKGIRKAINENETSSEHTIDELCDDMNKAARLAEANAMLELNKSGYAGILPNGNIVDRREYPDAIPVQKNPLFSVAEPKQVKPRKLCSKCHCDITNESKRTIPGFRPLMHIEVCEDCETKYKQKMKDSS